MADSKARGGVALRIEIDDEHTEADLGKARPEIDRRRGLPDATLLIRDRKDARQHDRFTFGPWCGLGWFCWRRGDFRRRISRYRRSGGRRSSVGG